MNPIEKRIEQLNQSAAGLPAEELLKLSVKEFGSRLILASSFGEEDQVLTHMLSLVAPQVDIFTLDTGRLFQETYDLMAKTQKRYPMKLQIYYPDTKAVEHMVREKGINLFYESVEFRKLCCQIRKVEPLKRALSQVDAWISGIRKEQSVTRQEIQVFEYDQLNQKIKINPLADWNLVKVREYILKERIDVNPLHVQGYVSIGCAPCTRPIKPGEDIRAGRWWWEAPEHKECGLHNNPNRPKVKSS